MKEKLYHIIFQLPRILKYRLLSTNKNIIGTPVLNTPCIMNGLGKIEFKNNVLLGVKSSPYYYNSYVYLEARNPSAKITIEENVFINNNACIVADKETIVLKKNTVVGVNCHIVDSDFHSLNPKERHNNSQKTSAVFIDENVFIGNNVTILKGVTIGKNSVVGNGSIVTQNIPENCVFAGVPAKKIKTLI